MTGKNQLRQQMRPALSLLPEAVKSAASHRLRAMLKALPEFQQARQVALFYPTATEPDLLPLIINPDKAWRFPLCHPDRSLTWHAPNHAGQWKRSRFGIIEPDPALDPPSDPTGIDLVLVPGLAFTESGGRLGHGAGYYDRFLASLPPSVPLIGICFDCQILPALPSEAHDIGMHRVLHA